MLRPLTPLEFKRRAVRLFGRKPAIIDGDRRFTYAEFGERVDRLCNALLSRGLERGQRVAVLATNSHPLLEAYFGVPQAGAILLPVNIRLSAREIATILEHAGASILLVDADFAELVEQVRRRLGRPLRVVWIGERVPGRDADEHYERMLEEASAGPPPKIDLDENDVAELFYTSGTTGRPRGVMLTHRNLYLHALSFLVNFRCAESDVQLHTISLFHVNGWGTPQAITAIGGTHVMLRKFDVGEVLRLVEQERVTRFLAVPTMLAMILEHPDIGRYDLSSLELINTGGAPTPPEMVRRAERLLGCQVVGGYGLTETSPLICFAADKSYLSEASDDARIRRRASTGLPLVGTELTLFDEQGRELPWDGRTVGELVVRGNVVSPGYWKDAAATEDSFRDGWFHTGDLATIDEEGYAHIVDRKKDIIISGGENISSLAIEKVLHEHPDVFECAVIGVPDDKWGEVPRAIVVLREGAEADESDLVAFCRSRLAGFEVPQAVDLVNGLPHGGTGKILKRTLREPFWAGKDKRVQ
ncbi:MAG: long-chain-fatty-acid--CoA ligase [Deltaproteobacteria bacterium]|nr:long-chain-fatty-acid--CoA ligase [Deltaproteobacteria bacterium]